jgi:hypothetical protein
MDPLHYELPQRIVSLLSTIGPLHEESTDTFHYKVDVILQQDKSVVGFLITQSPIEREPKVTEGNGLQFRVPKTPKTGGESTYIFTDTFENCLDYIRKHGKRTA